ncbi:MogA/MoaB family molybdenum cofactor biosynthesis protein [PVC group bacterium]|nr:MogA/MoaB family molybdenum cofactor biosynthesis protein [PVC group bacterium]
MTQHQSSVEARVAVLTVSDTRSIENDRSGSQIVELLTGSGHRLVERELVRDEMADITNIVSTWAKSSEVDVIIVTGGTGPSPRDVTPEAIGPMLGGSLRGFGELFRQLSFNEIGAAAMLSRADAGWIVENSFRTPIFMLPGSPKAVHLAMRELIIPQLGHLLAVCRGERTI